MTRLWQACCNRKHFRKPHLGLHGVRQPAAGQPVIVVIHSWPRLVIYRDSYDLDLDINGKQRPNTTITSLFSTLLDETVNIYLMAINISSIAATISSWKEVAAESQAHDKERESSSSRKAT